MSFYERFATSVKSMMTRKEENKEPAIKEVMFIVKECGAAPGTKEFFIASKLFTKKAERESREGDVHDIGHTTRTL
jgi:hypothetical protein